MGGQDDRTDQSPAAAEPEPVAFSNGIRLTGRQWLVVAAFAVLLVVFAPVLWKQVEPLPVEADYRVPYDLSNDYWLYER